MNIQYWILSSWEDYKAQVQFIYKLHFLKPHFKKTLWAPSYLPLNYILFMGQGGNLKFLIWQKSYQGATFGPIRWPIGSLTNFGPLFTFWDTQFSLWAALIQFMEGGFFKEICYIKNHPIALYCTLIENSRGFGLYSAIWHEFFIRIDILTPF